MRLESDSTRFPSRWPVFSDVARLKPPFHFLTSKEIQLFIVFIPKKNEFRKRNHHFIISINDE